MDLIRFTPIYKPTLWGGHKIQAYKNRPAGTERIGESWELCGMEGSETTVAEGPYKGLTLPALAEELKEKLVGAANYRRYGGSFPLLVKFIDACTDLSIQVHPKDELARMRHNCPGKNEMWYVIDAAPGARLCSGWTGDMTPEEYESRVRNHTIEEVLRWHEVRPGDVFNIPAGRVHSIGAGILLAEIQQPSDITYRIYDYDRRDAQGKPRELHTELAKDAIDYAGADDYRVAYTPCKDRRVELVDTPYYRTSLLDLTQPMTADYSATDSFTVYVCVGGKATLVSDGSTTCTLEQGETVLVPACVSTVEIRPEGTVKILESGI